MWPHVHIHNIIIILFFSRFCSVTLPRLNNMLYGHLLCVWFAARVAPLRKMKVLRKLTWVTSWKRTVDFFLVFLWQIDNNKNSFKTVVCFYDKSVNFMTLRITVTILNGSLLSKKKKCFRGFFLFLFVSQYNQTEIIKGEINLLRIIMVDWP